MELSWPSATYFNSGTAEARHRMADLEFVDRAKWYELYRRKSDGSYWRLDAADKCQQRFLIRIDNVKGWETFDSSPLEKSLLLARRGGLSNEQCVQQGCHELAVNGSAFCLNHTFERGVRK